MQRLPTLSFWRIQLLGWTAFAVAMAGSRFGRFPLAYMVASKGLLALMGLALTSLLVRPLYRRFLRDDASPTRTIVVVVLVSYLAAVVWTAADGYLDLPLVRALLDRPARLTSPWQLFGGALYNTFIILAWSVLYLGIKQQQVLQAERERLLRAEALAQSARLDALRFQLNPHFLFNSLNAISTLVLDDRRRDAAEMIARLADLLRATLDPGTGEMVSLEDELVLVRRYLDIERVRLGDRLCVEIDAPPSVGRARVPCLLLQPIVENAVRYAVASRAEGGRILIAAGRQREGLRIVVDDDGPGDAGGQAGSGIGLANVRERLAQHYGARQQFAIERSPIGGLRVRVEIPYDE